MKLQFFFPKIESIKNGPIGKRLLLALYLDMSINVFYVLYVAEMTKNWPTVRFLI